MPEYFDIHCHLLHGVDDGPRRIEQSLELLRMEYDDGVRTIFLTPHYRRDLFECPTHILLEHFEALRHRATQQFPDLQLILGREVHVHSDITQALRTGQCMTLGDSDHVLLEFPENADKRYLIDSCHAVIQGGYRPIIAHAERYTDFREHASLADEVQEMGALIQLNADSILGQHGISVRRCCHRLLKQGKAHFIASDAHDITHRKPILRDCFLEVHKKYGQAYAAKLFEENPLAVINNTVI